MVLKTKDAKAFVLRSLIFGSMLAGALMLGSCGSSEETAAAEDEGFEDTTAAAQPAEPAQEESSDQQALTSFIGAAPKKEAPKEEKPAEQPMAQTEPAASTTPAEDLRTENTSLKQQIVKLEQDNRTLNARISDAGADKAEEAAKVAAQSAAISARGAQVTMASEPVASDEAIAAYQDALQTFHSKAYDATISKLQAIIDGNPPNDLADNCQYWMGEANFGKKNYEEAIKHFQLVFQYQRSEKLADAHFMMAQCYERLGRKTTAKEEYEKVVKDFPTSRLVQKAKDRWARL